MNPYAVPVMAFIIIFMLLVLYAVGHEVSKRLARMEKKIHALGKVAGIAEFFDQLDEDDNRRSVIAHLWGGK